MAFFFCHMTTLELFSRVELCSRNPDWIQCIELTACFKAWVTTRKGNIACFVLLALTARGWAITDSKTAKKNQYKTKHKWWERTRRHQSHGRGATWLSLWEAASASQAGCTCRHLPQETKIWSKHINLSRDLDGRCRLIPNPSIKVWGGGSEAGRHQSHGRRATRRASSRRQQLLLRKHVVICPQHAPAPTQSNQSNQIPRKNCKRGRTATTKKTRKWAWMEHACSLNKKTKNIKKLLVAADREDEMATPTRAVFMDRWC